MDKFDSDDGDFSNDLYWKNMVSASNMTHPIDIYMTFSGLQIKR